MSEASRDPETLHPAARWRYEAWVEAAWNDGLHPLVYCFHRPLEEQARIWRRNRSAAEVKDGFDELERRGLEAAARALMAVGPQPGSSGPRLTNALPGTSFHQEHHYQGVRGALAFDWVPLIGGKAAWDRMDLYEKGAELAQRYGLRSGLRFTTFHEGPHIQFDDALTLDKWTLAAASYR